MSTPSFLNPTTPVHDTDASNSAPIERCLTAAVQRVLASPTFERTHRLAELLTYLCEHTLSGDGRGLKESAIGHTIFARPLNYSAADDNIVRSNIRQLRIKLDEYYQSPAGRGDPWRVAIPKGSYGLRLEPWSPGPGQGEDPVPESPAWHPAQVQPDTLPDNKTRPSVRTGPWLLAAAGMILGICVFAVQLRSSAGSAHLATLLDLLMADPGQKLIVLGPDSGVQAYRNWTGHSVQLEDFISRRYLSPEQLKRVAPDLPPQLIDMFRQHDTQSFFPGMIANYARIIPADALSAPSPESVTVKDFARDHAVLISGPFGNPWVQLFDRNLNFQITPESASPILSHLTNLHPRSGELPTYDNHTDAAGTMICYARLAYLPGRSPRTRVLLAGGRHSASTQAASQFLTRPDFLDSIRAKLQTRTLPWFEAVVETRALNNDPWTARIVAIHRVENQSSQ